MPNWSGGAKGAAGGAATGAAFGPWGAAIGGVIGGGIGLLSGGDDAEQKKRLDEYYKRVLGREAPQAGQASQSATSGFRANQAGLISRLEALSRGEGPSLATEQLRQATDRNMAQQSSIAQSGRGNAALSSIMAANNSARLGQQAAGDSATARIAEQQMALQQLGSNINAGRGADESNSQFNAQQQNFRDQANLEAQLRTMGLNDQAIQSILGKQIAPGMGDQLMAGGAGALALSASQRAQSKSGSGGGWGNGQGSLYGLERGSANGGGRYGM